MSDAGRKRWRRAVAVGLLGAGAMLGGWVGLSRSAPPEPATLPPIPTLPAADAWTKPAPQAPALAPPEVVPAVHPAVGLPAIPTIPAIPDAAPAGVIPTSLPMAPAVPPPALPDLPALPGSDQKKPETPTVVPPAPIMLPPSIDGQRPSAATPAPPPSPAKLPRPDPPANAGSSDSRLQGPNTGNTVKTEKTGERPGPVAPVVPVAPPVNNPVIPALPAVGSPGETSGTSVERLGPSEPLLQNAERDRTPNLTASTPGDNTVRMLNQSIAAAVIGGMLFGPGTAAPAQDKTELAELKTKVEAANTKLAEIQKDLKNLTELLNGRKDKDGFPIETSPGLIAELKKLTDRLATVEGELNKMKTQTSLRPGASGGTTPNASVDPRAGKGTVRIVNEYPVQISIVVNGTSYRIAPTKSLDIDVPAGEFTYQLLESGAASTKSAIKEKETVTLRIK